MTAAEQRVREKWPDAYCNHIVAPTIKGEAKRHWFICIGVYEDQTSISVLQDTPEEAWSDAASRITPEPKEGQ